MDMKRVMRTLGRSVVDQTGAEERNEEHTWERRIGSKGVVYLKKKKKKIKVTDICKKG